MTIFRGYTASHNFVDRLARLTPLVEYSESDRPHFGDISWPASWLPVQRQITDRNVSYWVVISTGKVIALDREGRFVPAGLRKKFNVSSGTTVLSYVAADVTDGTINLVTGVACTAAISYTEAQVTAGLRERGLIHHTERAMDFISKPIGIASYDFLSVAGSDPGDPRTWKKHNFQLQDKVAATCDYVAAFPVLPAVATSETMANDNTGGAAGALEDFFDGTTTPRVAGWFSSTQIAAVTRYANDVTAGDDVIGYMFVNYPLAKVTDESPMTASVSGLTREVSAITSISAAGDYFIDHEVGMLFVFESGGNAIPSPWATTSTITYYHYMAEGTDTNTVTTYACATGDLHFGDLLTYDANSNLVKATLDISAAEGYTAAEALYSADPEYDDETSNDVISRQVELAVQNFVFGIVGQVIGVVNYPKDNLDRVWTAYQGQTAANMRTPGSATGGRSDQLTYANGAEKMVVVNLIMR